MEFSILEVENNPIIREQFLQKTNDSVFCKKYGNLIHNVIWLENEFNLNMLHLFDSTHIQIEHLLQCSKVIKYLLEKNNDIYFWPNNNLKNLKPNKNTIEYIITEYPKKCDPSFLHYTYLFYQDLVVTFFKINGDTLDDNFIESQVKHILCIEYMDYFLIIEKYIPKKQFEKNLKMCMTKIFKKLSMEMLDYILLNYNLLTPQITLSLISIYDYSDDIMKRCQMYGQI